MHVPTPYLHALVCAAAVAAGGCVAPVETAAPLDETPNYTPAELARAGRVAIARKKEKLRTQGPKSFDEPQHRQEFHLAQRLSAWQPEYPMQHVVRTLGDIRAREQFEAAGGVAQPSWQWLGPGNIGGRTRALAIDRDDPDTMYAGGVGGGIWKTTDGGDSWTATDDLMLTLGITSIVIDPNDSNVLYAGTGEGVLSGRPGVRGLGIFKSTDAGETWNQLPGTVQGVPTGSFYYVNEVAISPNDSARIYAATRTGVWRSVDSGASWAPVLRNPDYLAGSPASNGSQLGCTDIAIRSDTSPDVVFACFGSFEADGLFRSLDGGDSWQYFNGGMSQGRMTIAFYPGDEDIVYLLMANNGSSGATGQLVDVYRSVNGGESWEPRVAFDTLTGPWLLSNLILATGCIEGGTYSQGWYDNIIKVDPTDPDTVWVGGVDIFRSDDGGVTWGIPAYWIFYTLFPPPPYQMHPDHHNIVFHPDYDGTTNQTMYVTNDGGIFRTLNARAATSAEDCPLPGDEPLPEIVWERLNNNYGVTQFYHGDSGVVSDVFAGGAQDNGTSAAHSGVTPNDWDLIFGGDGGYVAIDPTDSAVMYVEYQFFPTIQKSVDGGQTFVEATAGITDTDGLFITPVAMDQGDPAVLWTGGTRPWRTTNAAELWEVAGPNFAGPGQISAIGIWPADGTVVYLGYNNGYVARTLDGLSANPTWEVFTNGLYGAWVSSVTVDPNDPDLAYATYSNFGIPHIVRTANGGQSWIPIDGIDFDGVPDIPVHWLAVRPCDSQQLFAGTELGVFRSLDGGQTWVPFNEGGAHVIVEALDWRSDRLLVAYTHGRGAYQVDLGPCGPCPWDLDGSGDVGVGDFLDLLAAWGPNPGHPADLDGDGEVGITDFLALLANWGPCDMLV